MDFSKDRAMEIGGFIGSKYTYLNSNIETLKDENHNPKMFLNHC